MVDDVITIVGTNTRADDFGGGAFIGGGQMSARGKSLCGVLGGVCQEPYNGIMEFI